MGGGGVDKEGWVQEERQTSGVNISQDTRNTLKYSHVDRGGRENIQSKKLAQQYFSSMFFFWDSEKGAKTSLIKSWKVRVCACMCVCVCVRR